MVLLMSSVGLRCLAALPYTWRLPGVICDPWTGPTGTLDSECPVATGSGALKASLCLEYAFSIPAGAGGGSLWAPDPMPWTPLAVPPAMMLSAVVRGARLTALENWSLNPAWPGVWGLGVGSLRTADPPFPWEPTSSMMGEEDCLCGA
ncbi:unknown [Soft-shelled turtle iridovirus]|uniref:Uncharacterized protein n=1 Tax=Soft-shelled turtle iridovirus TaxID=365144 RepID=C3RWT0_FRG3V|nr:unknown [Soft-shelled turtle iridovirus]